jgi:hypothetical protein
VCQIHVTALIAEIDIRIVRLHLDWNVHHPTHPLLSGSFAQHLGTL